MRARARLFRYALMVIDMLTPRMAPAGSRLRRTTGPNQSGAIVAAPLA
jgi:hypothetical protein